MPSIELPALPLPKFSLDGKQRAALVAGRVKSVSGISHAQAKKLAKVAKAESERLGLPLGVLWDNFVEEDAEICGDVAAGIVLSHVLYKENKKTNEAISYAIPAALLTHKSASDVPPSFWAALAAAGLDFAAKDEEDDGQDDEQDDEDEGFGPTKDGTLEGVFLVPAGYTVASLLLDEAQLTCASDDTVPRARITPEVVARATAAKEVRLLADYA